MNSDHGPIDDLTGTSRRVRGAIGGNADDLAWTIDRLTPLLVQQARFRLRGRMQRVCDPEDVVAHAWQVSLPRLSGLIARDGRYTPVLLKFLSTSILLRVNELLRRELQRMRATAAGSNPGPDGAGATGAASVGSLPDPAPGVATEAVRRERVRIVQDTLQQLETIDREVIVLRMVEQRPAAEVGGLLGITAGAVNVRLHRALGRLRQCLPGSVFDDLAVESG
jgi:RNA polymerase sigma-70 factor, ECF subfamily